MESYIFNLSNSQLSVLYHSILTTLYCLYDPCSPLLNCVYSTDTGRVYVGCYDTLLWEQFVCTTFETKQSHHKSTEGQVEIYGTFLQF